MQGLFKSDFFVRNRKYLRKHTKAELIIITANGLLQRNGDNTFPFRQDSNFWYLTGINEPDILLVIDKAEEYLIVPERELIREQFDGKLDNVDFMRTSGIRQVLGAKEGRRKLHARLKQVRTTATVLPAARYLPFHGFYTNPARAMLVRRLKGVNPKIELEDLRLKMAQMRSVKQPEELKIIQKAIEITTATIQEIKQHNFADFTHEYEVETALTAGFKKRGASGHAFAPIVASGKHACQIHHTENNGPIVKDTQLLLDIGAELENYSADISRTYFIGKPTARYTSVFAAVHEVYEYARTQLKPGIIIRDYEKLIERYMGEKLQDLKLIQSLDRKAIRRYYPHATSHFLGLDTHDAGDYSEPLKPNMVLTVEPGIYIPEEGIGVRIEDDVLITEKGNTVLSRNLS